MAARKASAAIGSTPRGGNRAEQHGAERAPGSARRRRRSRRSRRGARTLRATSSMRAASSRPSPMAAFSSTVNTRAEEAISMRAVGRDEAGLDGARRLQQLARHHQVDLAGRRVERQHGPRAGAAWRAPRRARSRGSRWWRRCAARRPGWRCPARNGRWRSLPCAATTTSTPPPSPPSAAISTLMGLRLGHRAHSAGTQRRARAGAPRRRAGGSAPSDSARRRRSQQLGLLDDVDLRERRAQLRGVRHLAAQRRSRRSRC